MFVRLPALASLAVALLLSARGAAAVTVSGHVRDEQGVGIFNSDLDFFDRNLGQIIFTPNDNTDFNGFYSVDVPVSEYDITFKAPTGSPYLDQEIRVDITGPMTIDMVLPVGQWVSGLVTDVGATPLFNVDLNFFDVALQTVIPTDLNNVDNTDSLGVFGVNVPAATYDIRFTAPAGQPYAGKEIPGVVVAGSTFVGTVVLEPGLFVSGNVVGPGAVPVTSTDLDFEDTTTGDAIYTPRDNTDSTGAFNVAVPTGTYDVIVNSPAGSGLAWKTVHDVSVLTNLSLGTVQLAPGFALTGTVQDEGAAPMVNSDLDMIEQVSGQELPTPNDNTDATGAFSLLLPATTIDLVAAPPAGVAKAAAIVRDVVISGATNVGTITLPTGFALTGTVTASGAGVPAVDIDAFDIPAGTKIYPTPGDDTDGTGAYSIRLPGGTYLLVANPPVGSGLSPDSTIVVALSADTIVNFDITGAAVGVPSVAAGPSVLTLLPNLPNPFRSSTSIGFEIPSGFSRATVSVYDTAGRLVRAFERDGLAPGPHSVRWDGRDRAGRRVASGVYHYRLQAAGESVARKMVILN